MTRSHAANGHRGNAVNAELGLPPSTLAAQIVEHHSVTNGNVQADNSTFRQLLEEIRASPNALEVDPSGNKKLILVVVEAGLGGRDPFVRQEETKDQVIACLEVVEIALKRTPEILMRDAVDGSVFRAPCWLLLSKLVYLLSVSELRGAVRRLLRVITRILLRTPGCWYQEHAWKRVMGVIATGELRYVELGSRVAN